MAGGKFSEASLFGMTIRESADDGSDFTNPAADYRRLFLGEDGQLHVKDSAGTVTSIGGSGSGIATDPIWDAAGDLVQGTGANTAAKLTAGTAGMFLKSAGAAAANLWAYPPGYELDYAQFTSPVSITATSEATANTIVTGNAVAYDGSTIVQIEYWMPYYTFPLSANVDTIMVLYDGSSSIGFFGLMSSISNANTQRQIPRGVRRLTPSAATHTYSIRAYTSSGTGSAGAGSGGAAAHQPGFIRITKV